jgi:hypothetical protein
MTRPDLTNCYKSLKEAQKEQKRTTCAGKNIEGKESKARILNLQFHDTKYNGVKKPEKMVFKPDADSRYNLERSNGFKEKNAFTNEMSLSGTGYKDEKSRFYNYDFSLLMDETENGEWIHGTHAGKPPKYDTTNYVINTQYNKLYKKVLSPAEQQLGKKNEYKFNQQFYCVLCEKQWENGKPK